MSYTNPSIAQLPPIEYTVDNNQVSESTDQNMDYYNQVLTSEPLVSTENTPIKRKCTENEKLSQFVLKDNDIYSCNVKGCMIFNPQKSWHRFKAHLFKYHADKLVEAGINVEDKDRKSEDLNKIILRKGPPSKRTRLPMDYFRNFCKKDEESGKFSCNVPNCKDFHPQKSITRLKQHLVRCHERYMIENGIKEDIMKELKDNLSILDSANSNSSSNTKDTIQLDNISKYKKGKNAGVGAPLTKMILSCDVPFRIIDNNYFIEFLRTSSNNSDIYSRIMKERIIDFHLLDCYNMIKMKQCKIIEESQSGYISINIFELPYDRKVIILFFHNNSGGKIILCGKSQICVSLQAKKLEEISIYIYIIIILYLIVKYTIEEWSMSAPSLKEKIFGYRINNIKYYNIILESCKNLGNKSILDEEILDNTINNNLNITASIKISLTMPFIFHDYAGILKRIFALSIGEGSSIYLNNIIGRDKYSELLHRTNRYRALFRQMITSFNLIYDIIGYIKDQKECRKFPEVSVYNSFDLWYERIEILLQDKEERNVRIEIFKKLYEGNENINYEIEKLLNSLELYDDNFYNFYENVINVFKPYQNMIVKMNSNEKYDLSCLFVDLISCRNNNNKSIILNSTDGNSENNNENSYSSLFDDLYSYFESYFQYDYMTLAYLLDPTVVNPLQQIETHNLKITSSFDPIEYVVEGNNIKKMINDEDSFKEYLSDFVHSKKVIIMENNSTNNTVENKALWFKNDNNDLYKIGNMLFSFNMNEDYRWKNISFDFINDDERLKESEFMNRYIICKENVELIDILDGKQLNNTYDKLPIPVQTSYSV